MAKNEVINHFRTAFPEKNGVFHLTSYSGAFEESYLVIRRREDRFLNEGQILALPERAPNPSHTREWKVRLRSGSLLRDHLHHHRMKTVLELGCGNGWLTNFLSKSVESVIGLDINLTELEVGAKLFDEPVFAYGNIESEEFVLPTSVDAIVIASAIQYFENPVRLVNTLLNYLTPGGEIHIIDSPIYRDEQASSQARVRSLRYFTSLNVEFPTYYQHHSFEDFGTIPINVLYNPDDVFSRINRWIGWEIRPFPWLIIKKPV